MDILCQAKSGMGKTAVFVLATLQQLEPVDGQVCLSVCLSVSLLYVCGCRCMLVLRKFFGYFGGSDFILFRKQYNHEYFKALNQ